jgi:hypothetical protein
MLDKVLQILRAILLALARVVTCIRVVEDAIEDVALEPQLGRDNANEEPRPPMVGECRREARQRADGRWNGGLGSPAAKAEKDNTSKTI